MRNIVLALILGTTCTLSASASVNGVSEEKKRIMKKCFRLLKQLCNNISNKLKDTDNN